MKALTFIVTDKCNVTCDFCAPGCGPTLKNHLTSSQMIKIIEDISRSYILRLVVFTGGEPMLYWWEIQKTIASVRKKSPIAAIRIVTNVSWATSVQKATAILGKLQAAGLTELNYSVDDFHQANIPEQRIINGVEAAHALGLPVLLAHKTYPGSRTNHEYYEALLSRPILSIDSMTASEFEDIKLAISSGYTVPVGRGSENVFAENWIPYRYASDAGSKYCPTSWAMPCREVLNSFTVTADGRLSPCCGLVDRSVRIFSAGDVLQEDVVNVVEKYCSSTLYNWLALEGPGAIRDFINAKHPLFQENAQYVQACQLCQEIFSNEVALKVILEGMPEISASLSIKRCTFEAGICASRKSVGRATGSPI